MRVPTGRLRIVSTPQGDAADTHEGPPSPGHYIREQRQRRGMSVEQLAIDTKIPRASIDALEEDRFTALPGPVFVKGFFRCCARSLSLDAEVVMALLHEHERAQQQLKSGGRRERNAPQLLGRNAAAAPGNSYGIYGSQSGAQASGSSSGSSFNASSSFSAGAAAARTPPMPPRSHVPSAPVHAVPGEPALTTPIGPLFDFRAVAPLLASLGRILGRILGRMLGGPGLSRVTAAVRGASNSRLLMWIAVSLMIALIVVTAFVMAGGTAPNPAQS